ncbi:MAG TPA: CopD family protein [Candidatus Binatia bacterium]|nr:CopD family protein [Candidatus Binatia bacterium]
MDAAFTLVGWLDLAATCVVAGAVVYGALVEPPSACGRRAVSAALRVLAVTLAAAFALVAIRMWQVARIGGTALVLDLLATRWGRLWLARAAGLAALGAALARPRPAWPALVAVVLPWLLLRSFQGHAGAHGVVPAVADGVHLVAAAAWLGGLVQLALAGDASPTSARRFRTLATCALALVLPTGVYGALLHVPTVVQLLGSPYGLTLCAKLALVAALAALGAANHFRHVPALVAGAPAAARLRRTVRVELALAAAVLLLSALLGVLPMPHGPVG